MVFRIKSGIFSHFILIISHFLFPDFTYAVQPKTIPPLEKSFDFTLKSPLIEPEVLKVPARRLLESSPFGSKESSIKETGAGNFTLTKPSPPFTPKRGRSSLSQAGLNKIQVEDDWNYEFFLSKKDSRGFSGFQVGKNLDPNFSLKMGLLDDTSVSNPLSNTPLVQFGLERKIGQAAAIEGGVSLNLAGAGESILVGGPGDTTVRSRQRNISVSVNPHDPLKPKKSGYEKIREGLPDDLFINFRYGFSPHVKGGISYGNIDNQNLNHYENDYLGVHGSYKYNDTLEIRAGVKGTVFNLNENIEDRNVWTEFDLKF